MVHLQFIQGNDREGRVMKWVMPILLLALTTSGAISSASAPWPPDLESLRALRDAPESLLAAMAEAVPDSLIALSQSSSLALEWAARDASEIDPASNAPVQLLSQTGHVVSQAGQDAILWTRVVYRFACGPDLARRVLMFLDSSAAPDRRLLPYPAIGVTPYLVGDAEQAFHSLLRMGKFGFHIHIDLPVYKFCVVREGRSLVYQLARDGRQCGEDGRLGDTWILGTYARSVLVPAPTGLSTFVVTDCVSEVRRHRVKGLFRPSANTYLEGMLETALHAGEYFNSALKRIGSGASFADIESQVVSNADSSIYRSISPNASESCPFQGVETATVRRDVNRDPDWLARGGQQ